MTPTNPQPPDKCPACGCTEFRIDPEEDYYVTFACGAVCSRGLIDFWTYWNEDCSRSFSAAIALRAERDALTDELENETGLMPSEGPATNAQIVEAVHTLRQQIGDAKEIISDLRAELAEAKRYSAHLEHENAALAVLHSNAVDERDAALARAEKAEGERDGVMARNQYMADELILIRDILRGAEIEIDDEDSVANGVSVLASCDKEEIKRADLWYGEYMTKSELLESTEAELTAARARLAELQAVCDAAIAWNLLYRVLPSREFWYGERAKVARENLSNAVNKYHDALASGAESETK